MTAQDPASGAKFRAKEAGAPLLAACGLTALAGWVDAQVVLRGGEILPVYMTGNSAKLAESLASGALAKAWPLAAVILAFLASSTLAARLARGGDGGRPAPALLLVGGMLVLAILLGLGAHEGRWPLGVLLAVAAAMGAVNQVLQGDPGVTFITGALVRTARALAAGEVLRAGRNLLRWASLLAGAAASALIDPVAGAYALVLPAGATLLAGAFLALRPSVNPAQKEHAA
ncbi:DUF1275 domain-containing protein [Roseomonas populi]|uniref:DUF1275 domain-containing protein n=1 Tax=Roseomonas populi TaxID=3121582 RepID=A0ABT1XAL5_9PROT|nr:DUF1275 domain-containing protein [Roseomonas pecuniae]MCR0984468.1 DUF1275 domain-containing protein [Roseomonas pecuniae]